MTLTQHEMALAIGLGLALVGVAVMVARFVRAARESRRWWDERHGKGDEDEDV